MNNIKDKQIVSVLDKLHLAARDDRFKIIKLMVYNTLTKLKPEHAKTAYLPVSKKQGEYMYDIVVKNNF